MTHGRKTSIVVRSLSRKSDEGTAARFALRPLATFFCEFILKIIYLTANFKVIWVHGFQLGLSCYEFSSV